MNYIAILGGGTGERMGTASLPKQFIEIGGTPIIILTLKNILESNLFDMITIAMHEDWCEYMLELMKKHSIPSEKIKIICGGKTRLDSIENVVDEIEKTKKNIAFSSDDILLIHDAVRPFVDKELLQRTLLGAKKHRVTVAVTPVKDSMMWIEQEGIVASIPDRSKLFHGQSPEGLQYPLIRDTIKKLTPEEREKITGTVQICQMKGIAVHTVAGDEKNIKITTPADLIFAEAILKSPAK